MRLKMKSWILSFFLATCCTRLYAFEGIANILPGMGKVEGNVVILSKADLVSMLMAQKIYWDNGVKITVYVLPKDNSATREFLISLGIPPNAYFDSIENKYSSGKANVPQVLPTDISMVLNVGNTLGSIGYIKDGNLLNLTPFVKTIRLDSK